MDMTRAFRLGSRRGYNRSRALCDTLDLPGQIPNRRSTPSRIAATEVSGQLGAKPGRLMLETAAGRWSTRAPAKAGADSQCPRWQGKNRPPPREYSRFVVHRVHAGYYCRVYGPATDDNHPDQPGSPAAIFPANIWHEFLSRPLHFRLISRPALRKWARRNPDGRSRPKVAPAIGVGPASRLRMPGATGGPGGTWLD